MDTFTVQRLDRRHQIGQLVGEVGDYVVRRGSSRCIIPGDIGQALELDDILGEHEVPEPEPVVVEESEGAPSETD